MPSQTVTHYDGQGRVVSSQFYSLGQYQWQTTTSYPGRDETDVTPPSGATATSTFTNALGKTTATWSYADSATPTGKAADADVTGYTYTPSGQVATVSDNAETSGLTPTTCWARRSRRPTRTPARPATGTTRTAT